MTKLYCLMCLIVLLSVTLGCQSNSSSTDNSSGTDKETQARITQLEEKMSKLESEIQEKDIGISNLKQQVSMLASQNDNISTEFHQFKSYSENKFAINDIDIEKLMWNVWISLGLSSVDSPYLSERYGDYSQFEVGERYSIINRPVLCNKLVNKVIASETTPLTGHQ